MSNDKLPDINVRNATRLKAVRENRKDKFNFHYFKDYGKKSKHLIGRKMLRIIWIVYILTNWRLHPVVPTGSWYPQKKSSNILTIHIPLS